MYDQTKALKTELDTQPQHLQISHMLHVVILIPVSLIKSLFLSVFICLHTSYSGIISVKVLFLFRVWKKKNST